MKLTIIPSDGAVYENGVAYENLTWDGTPSNIHALQWDNGSGWIEFNDGTPNQEIIALPTWAGNAEIAWNNANMPVPPLPPTAEQNKLKAQGLLTETDWTQLPDVALTNKADFATYRQALRDIVFNPQPGDINFPTRPQEVWS